MPSRSSTAITPRTKAIIINSPCNPTGALIAEEELAAIADAAATRGIWVIVDSDLREADLRAGAAQPAARCSASACAIER